MPPRPAKGRVARSLVNARGAPEGLESFLGGMSIQEHTNGAESGAMIEMNLRLLQKNSETTLMKALAELNRLVTVVAEQELLAYIPNIIEAVLRHAEHTNSAVRAGIFAFLQAVGVRGESPALRAELERGMPPLATAWVARMNDMEVSVRKEAREAFNLFFSTVVLQRHADAIVVGLIDMYKTAIERSNGKPLQDDCLDSRSNTLYSSVSAMGYMLRQFVAAQQKIVEFVEQNSLQPILPSREGNSKKNGCIVAKTPVVRSASLSLLSGIVELKLLTPQVHRCISNALYNAVLDDECVVVRRVWELLLLWCREDTEKAISFFYDDFLRDVMGSFLRCNSPELAEVIYPSIVPLLVPLTRDVRCADVINEFAAALLQRLECAGTMSLQEWRFAVSALMQLWELLCVRVVKQGAGVKGDCTTMFCRIIATLVSAVGSLSKQERHLDTAVSVIAPSVTRMSRHSECFCGCVHILCGRYDAICNASPVSAHAECFEILQARLVASILVAGITDPTFSSFLREAAEGLIVRYANERRWGALAEQLRVYCVAGTVLFVPREAVRLQVVEGLLGDIKRQVTVNKNEEADAQKKRFLWSLYEELLLLVLMWNDDATRKQLEELCASASSELQWVGETLCAHDMKDHERLLCIFLRACADADFLTINRCVNAFDAMKKTLSEVEKEQLRQAVQQSIEATLSLVIDDSDNDDDTVAMETTAAKLSAQAVSGFTCNENEEEDEEDEEKEDCDEDGATNKGVDVLQRLVGFAELLRKGEHFATLLDFTGDDLNLPAIFRSVVAVAPRLQPEQCISIKALRVALQDDSDPLLQAMAKKTHSLSVSQFNTLVARVEELLDSHEVSVEQRDTISLALFDDVVQDVCSGITACNQLSRLLPFASNILLQGVACSAELWAEQEILLRDQKLNVPFAMMDRYCSLDMMHLSMLRCVRTAQLVHLLGVSVQIETCDVVAVTLPLLHAARVQEALADQIQKLLMTKLLPRALLRLSSPEEVEALLAADSGPHFLLCTLIGVFCDVAVIHGDALVANARCVANVATQWIVNALLLGEGSAPVHVEALAAYRSFFALLDEMADIVGESILSSISTRQAAAVTEAMCMLPTLEQQKALLVMTIHRHLNSSPVVVASTVQQIIAHAKLQRPIDGLELLSELASSRIIDTISYNGLINTITHMMACVCRLRHMPPNGRLLSQAANDLPMPLKDLCRVVVSAVFARRGAVLHGRVADILRSSVNLILFDAVTECVVSLRQAKDEDVPLVTRLLAFTSKCLGFLITSDVAVLRSSELSVVKVANVMNYAYQWLCATPIAKLERIGMDTVASSIRAVALLSHLTLMRSAVVLLPTMQQLRGKRLLKNLRTEFTTRSPARVSMFMRNAAIISKTNKQKLALFLHLLAWCVTLSGPSQEDITEELRKNVFHLLDLLCSLLLTSAVPGSCRLDCTFLGGSKSSAADEQLGFETVALTRSDAAEPMKELAKGAAATFALLLQCNTLPIVRSWLETIEQKLQDLFYTFVETHVSPVLVQESLLNVLSKSESGQSTFDVSENYNVKVSLEKKLIALRYTMEDVGVTVQIAFPTAFPLRHPIVTHESGRDCGVSTDKWRSWMLKMTALLFGGSSNVWECVSLFGRNLDAHFSGQEPCPICFAVVSSVGHRLPDMRCAVCRNAAIHSSCLYAWWATSNQTVCPLCRSPWVSG